MSIQPMTASVVMITYGHQDYIKEAIEGVLMQLVDFEIELIIANDKSPDKTEKIIHQIIKEHPKASWIQYVKHNENKGMMGNFTWALAQAQGKYIALCEGDDYWTDPLKLQKQVDFLEAHPECAFCFTRAEQEFTGTDKKNIIYPKTLSSSVLSATDYLDIPTTATCSLVFRNYPKTHGTEFTMLPHSHGDFLLYCNLLQLGKAGAIEDVTCVYRKQAGGVSFRYSSENYLYNRIKEYKLEEQVFQNPEVIKAIQKKYKNSVHEFLIKYPRSSKAKAIKQEIDIDLDFWITHVKSYFRMIKNKLSTYV